MVSKFLMGISNVTDGLLAQSIGHLRVQKYESISNKKTAVTSSGYKVIASRPELAAFTKKQVEPKWERQKRISANIAPLNPNSAT